MSGGHFDYEQYRIRTAANQLEEDLESIDRYEFEEYTVTRLRETVHALHQASEMLQRVDWLLCGDDGEDSFHQRWDQEVRSYWNSPYRGETPEERKHRLARLKHGVYS